MKPDTPTPETRIRCGDIVRHRPTGETWVVAYADYERDELAWQGWPDGCARLHDCELVEPCSDEEHTRNVRMCIEANLGNRTSAVRRLYVEEIVP